MASYLKNRMKLVYLDQCVVSRLIERRENGPWKALKDEVLAAHSARRILCPTSLEHLVETAGMRDCDAIAVDQLLRRLSFGWSLAPEPRLIARQVFCQIGKRGVTKATFLQKHLWNPLSNPGALEELRCTKRDMDAHNEWMMQGVNEINALISRRRHPSNEVLQILINKRSESYVQRLQIALSKAAICGRVEISADPHQPKCADWASTVVFALVREHRLNREALSHFCTSLSRDGLLHVPTLRIKAELEAYQFFTGQKIEARDQYDITRIACALPYSDILVTDGGKAQALRELDLHRTFGVELFSMKKAELPLLIARLDQLASS